MTGFDVVIASDASVGVLDLAGRTRVAQALVDKGNALIDLERYEEAIACFERVVTRFAGSREIILRERTARALRRKAYALIKLGRHDDAVSALTELAVRFENATEPELRKSVAIALVAQVDALNRVGRHAEAVRAADLFLARLVDDPPVPTKLVVRALFWKAHAERELGRVHEALSLYSETVERYGDAAQPDVRRIVAGAMTCKANELAKLDLLEQAVKVRDELVMRFGDEPAVRGVVAVALYNKAVALCKLGRREEAVAVLDDVVRSADAADPGLNELAARTLCHLKGLARADPA